MYYDEESLQPYSNSDHPVFTIKCVNPSTGEYFYRNVRHHKDNIKDLLGLLVISTDRSLCSRSWCCGWCDYLKSRITQRKDWSK